MGQKWQFSFSRRWEKKKKVLQGRWTYEKSSVMLLKCSRMHCELSLSWALTDCLQCVSIIARQNVLQVLLRMQIYETLTRFSSACDAFFTYERGKCRSKKRSSYFFCPRSCQDRLVPRNKLWWEDLSLRCGVHYISIWNSKRWNTGAQCGAGVRYCYRLWWAGEIQVHSHPPME